MLLKNSMQIKIIKRKSRMRFISLLFLSLSLFFAPLHPADLVMLLDEVYEAQQYWSNLAATSRAYFWKQPLTAFTSCFNTRSWQNTIKKNQAILAQQEIDLISQLADYYGNDQKKIAQDNKATALKQKKLLKKHGIPQHFARKWIKYIGAGALITGFAAYLSYFYTHYTLFVIDPNAPSLEATFEDDCPFLGHDYVRYNDGKQFLQVKNDQIEIAKTYFAAKQVAYTIQNPEMQLSFYNTKGQSKFYEFIDIHGIAPFKKIIKILKNESSHDTPMLSTDTQHDQKVFEEQLTNVLKDGLQFKEFAPTIETLTQGRSLDTLSFPEKKNIFTALFFHAGQIMPVMLKDGLAVFSDLIKSTQNAETPNGITIPHIPTFNLSQKEASGAEPETAQEESFIAAHSSIAKEITSRIKQSHETTASIHQKFQQIKDGHEPKTEAVARTRQPQLPITVSPPSWSTPEVIQNINRTLANAQPILEDIDDTLSEVQTMIPPTKKIIQQLNEDVLPQITQGMQQTNSLLLLFQNSLHYISTISENHYPDLFSFIYKIALLRIQQRDLQAAAAMHKMSVIVEQAKLNLELSATIPLLIATFIGYKTCTGIYNLVTNKHFVKKMKKDIILFQLLLNKNRYKSLEFLNSDVEYCGLSFYRITKLQKYMSSIPTEQQTSYKQYLTELEQDTLNPEQKLIILDCLFKEFSFLQ